ncbi:hypothetical protein LQ953_13205 [Sphingomonas sp. IC-56]|uniref:hypothetical protein n=1 Tax=Sphingomonas sp. IC-56 TaxID=2898529 RepID=UPI001E554C92|nr:hypothetical protein [Sphingomonas sp. IC-56]MCD2324975.1 hypothetical protein [Sphingomonas sp. IC-56]
MASRAHFRPEHLTRALKAAAKAGCTIARSEIDPDGRIVLIHDRPGASAPENPFDAWQASRNAH